LPSWVKVIELSSTVSPLALASLDLGEAAVIQLALENNIDLVCIDELKGRSAARAVGLNVVGSLGLLGRAKRLGLTASVRPFIQRAVASGIFYDQGLIESFLRSLGE
jgi:predicted nucleic acid-binding protein